ncbi:hypothetical protein CDL12_24216 [Handroanthus impetiginosus]|uniref:Uncharacterized protein n=1 Tax=Handroanthus impetiginosus TaxID=429701 RepID=A0A2G9GDI6_9LAMI|nr:hypothetical protein CDL12_24216 [Handroanthus impetiginosus]
MEMEHNCSQDSSLTIAPMYEYSEDQYLRARSCCMDDLVLSGISALYNSMSWMDANRGKLQSSCYHSSMGDVSMNSKITYASSKDL